MGVGIVGMAGMDEDGRDGMLGGMRCPRHVGMVRVGVGVPWENTHRSISLFSVFLWCEVSSMSVTTVKHVVSMGWTFVRRAVHAESVFGAYSENTLDRVEG